MKNRPFGVALISILVIIEAIIQIIASLAMLGVSTFSFFAAPGSGLGAALLVLAIIALIIGIVELAVASGLWNMEKWAWIVAVVVCWIDVIFDFIGGIAQVQTWGATLLSAIIPVIVLIYLYQTHIKKLFK